MLDENAYDIEVSILTCIEQSRPMILKGNAMRKSLRVLPLPHLLHWRSPVLREELEHNRYGCISQLRSALFVHPRRQAQLWTSLLAVVSSLHRAFRGRFHYRSFSSPLRDRRVQHREETDGKHWPFRSIWNWTTRRRQKTRKSRFFLQLSPVERGCGLNCQKKTSELRLDTIVGCFLCTNPALEVNRGHSLTPSWESDVLIFSSHLRNGLFRWSELEMSLFYFLPLTRQMSHLRTHAHTRLWGHIDYGFNLNSAMDSATRFNSISTFSFSTLFSSWRTSTCLRRLWAELLEPLPPRLSAPSKRSCCTRKEANRRALPVFQSPFSMSNMTFWSATRISITSHLGPRSRCNCSAGNFNGLFETNFLGLVFLNEKALLHIGIACLSVGQSINALEEWFNHHHHHWIECCHHA